MSEVWAWVSGWAVCPARFEAAVQKALPGYTHVVFAPSASALDNALQTAPAKLGGYSLGSLLLLSGLERIPCDVALYGFAPFTAFCVEHGRGGTTPVAALEMIQARLRQQPEKALKLFYRLSGLKSEPLQALPYAIDDLAWGLEALKTIQAKHVDLSRVTAILGKHDPLVNHDHLENNWKNSIQADCQHDYGDLLQAFAKAHAQ
jgi:hypothetical protein